MQPNEVWKNIQGYEGFYQVSSLGRIRSLPRKNHLTDSVISQFSKKSGYKCVSLFKNNIKTNFHVHRLVAEAFLPNPQTLSQVNHKDYMRDNNSVDNLEWISMEENIAYSYCNVSKRPVNQYRLDGTFVKRWDCISDVSRELGMYRSDIAKCCRGVFKQSKGYKWRYADE